MILNPSLKIVDYSKDLRELFTRYPSMSLKELIYLSDLPREQAESQLTRMCDSGELTTWDTKRTKLYLSTVKLEQGFV